MDKISPPQSQGDVTPPSSQEVIDRLENFYIIQNPKVRTIFGWIPLLLILLVIADWLLGVGTFSRDTFRMTTVLMVALALIAIQILFDQLPKVLKTVWRRGVIDVSEGDGNARAFLEYINQFEKTLNAKYSFGLALVFAIGALLTTYPFRYLVIYKSYPFDFGTSLIYYFGGQAAVIAPILGFMIGLLVWQVGTIAYFIGLLGKRFPLKIQVNHPDQSGGLKPLGDLAFNIAIIILIPSIFLAVWGFITTFIPNPALEGYITLWGSLFRELLVALAVLSLFVFIQPLYAIHIRMEEHAQKIRADLDSLSQKIEILSQELRSQADEIDSRQGEEKLRTIEFMKRVYQENSQPPTWPFNWRTVFRYASAQIIPLLSLLGTSGPIVNMINSLISGAN